MLKTIAKGLGWLIGTGAVLVLALYFFGPYETVDTEFDFDPGTIPDDLDGWLADRENQVPNLREDEAKRILWAGVPGEKTEIAIVYIHGFSAGIWEIRPVPDRVAEALGANLHFGRLTGHGRDGAAMAEPGGGDWLRDVAEAVTVGQRIGERVIVISTSQGGTLTALLAADPAMAPWRDQVAGVAMISPNFKVANPMAELLSWPAARYWAPLVGGETRTFEAQNDRHARHWTTSYPTVAGLPLQAVIDRAETMDWSQATIPALFLFDPQDIVVDASVTEKVAANWGAAVTIERTDRKGEDDPDRHVIAGDILSPEATPDVIATLLAWIETL